MRQHSARARAAIVDPYSSGARLAGEFARFGLESVAVLSTRRAPELFRSSYRRRDFIRVVHWKGDPEETADRLRRLNVEHLLPGCDLGLEVADLLGERLGVNLNGTRLARARRDKYVMTETVRARGLDAPAQCRASSPNESLAWATARDRWPVILKPVRGTASDGVLLCDSPDALARSHRALITQTNVLGLTEPQMLVQEFLPGIEYAVDTVSHDGRHRLAGLWRYRRPAHGAGEPFVCYDAMELLPGDNARADKLFAYTRGVLDALDIRHGAAHAEMIWVDGRGPVLVEVSPRMNAGNNAVLAKVCGARASALELTVRAEIAPERFLREVEDGYRLSRHATNRFLIPRQQGRLHGVRRLDEIRALRSFHRLSVGARVGRPVPRVVGAVTLVHEDAEVIELDLQRIRELEADGLYDIRGGG